MTLLDNTARQRELIKYILRDLNLYNAESLRVRELTVGEEREMERTITQNMASWHESRPRDNRQIFTKKV